MSLIVCNNVVYGALAVFLIIFCVNIKPLSCDVDSSLLCSKEYCNSVNCTAVPIHCSINNATHSGINMLDPTFCNCCEYCMVNLLEGDECSQGGLGSPPTGSVCGPGLSCDSPDGNTQPTCQRMKSTCHDAQDDYDERREDGTLGITVQRPECDDEGLFGPRICLPGQNCYCQNRAGERIFGEVVNENNAGDNMHCRCSRIADSTSELLGDVSKSPRCNADGSFDPLQCIGSRCFCVNEETGILSSSKVIDLVSQPLTDLQCFNRSIHHNHLSYLRICEEEFYEMLNEITTAESEGYSFLGNPFPACQPDGWYAEVMKIDNRKVCVDPQGNQIDTYGADDNTAEGTNIDCKCARTQHILESSKSASFMPVCCPNGNWRKVQCRRDMCYCVDSNGVQQGQEVSSDLVDTLPCNATPC